MGEKEDKKESRIIIEDLIIRLTITNYNPMNISEIDGRLNGLILDTKLKR